MKAKEYFEQMYRIRHFEETLLELFSDNSLTGTTHTSIGQEAVAVAALSNITEDDCVFSNHRCHGHFLAYEKNVSLLLAEIMGKKTGMCRGRGGSQHICCKNFYTNGVQGGIVANAAGAAFAEKLKGTSNITMVFLGDGTLGQGLVYETFNLASLYDIPILFIIEDNGYAMSTKSEDAVAGSMPDRARAFGIQTAESFTNDVFELDNAFKEAVEYVRSEGRPFCQVVHTYRLAPHSKGDDFRDPAEIEEHRQFDPLKLISKYLSENEIQAIKQKIAADMKAAIEKGSNEKAETGEEAAELQISMDGTNSSTSLLSSSDEKFVKELNYAWQDILSHNQKVYFLGEDICDPYGGAFKVTKGLSERYADQLINTPISEAGITGLSVGMAMRGLIPVLEIMFGDFLSLCFDQILNHAAKYNWMYAGQIQIPLILRTPMGGGRGYGATHSQTLEKFFIGIPNIMIIAPSLFTNLPKLFNTLIQTIDRPVILIENKKMYAERLKKVINGRWGDFFAAESNDLFPITSFSLVEDEDADASIITYGAMVPMSFAVAKKLLIEDEMLVNVVVLTQIAPIQYESLCSCISSTENVITLEEGTVTAGWGSEVIAGLNERFGKKHYMRIGAKDTVIPVNTTVEDYILPNEDSTYQKIRGMLRK